jgi:hypothetical protein
MSLMSEKTEKSKIPGFLSEIEDQPNFGTTNGEKVLSSLQIGEEYFYNNQAEETIYNNQAEDTMDDDC